MLFAIYVLCPGVESMGSAVASHLRGALLLLLGGEGGDEKTGLGSSW